VVAPKTEQTIELVVAGDLTLPEIASAALSGKAVTLTIVGAKIVGYAAAVGTAEARGPRPSQKGGKDFVRVRLEVDSVVIAEDAGGT